MNKELNLILEAVCDVLDVDDSDVRGKARKPTLVYARGLFTYIAYRLDIDVLDGGTTAQKWSLTQLANFLNKKSHAAISKRLAEAEPNIMNNARTKHQIKAICKIMQRPDLLDRFEHLINHTYGQKEIKNVFGIKYYR